MRARKLHAAIKPPHTLDASLVRSKWRKIEPPRSQLSRSRLAVAKSKASRAPSLTLRQIIDKVKTLKMVDIILPTTDGRTITLPRHIKP